jgi:capsular polysaccharide biosynthesis protein
MPENNNVIATLNRVHTGNPQDDEIEIDLGQLFFALRQRIVYLLLALVLGLGLGFGVSRFVLTPTYTSTSMIYVMTKETTLTSLADLQIGSQLTTDYKVLITSRTVMEDVIQKLGLDMDYNQLRSKITLDNPSNTRILNISVLDTDPAKAKQITDAVAESASNYIADIMEQDPPKIIEYGEIPLKKTGPHNTRNAVISGVLAMLLVAGWVTIDTITNDTIKTEDDIENYFGVPVLAAIPKKDPEAARRAEKQGEDYRKHERKGGRH